MIMRKCLDSYCEIDKFAVNYFNRVKIPKISHKICKLIISSLFDMGLNLNKIREMAGHEDERISLNNNCFSRKTDSETEKILESTCLK